MLEVLLIMSIAYAIMYMPLRGKDFSHLTPKQQEKVEKNYTKYMKTRKGQKTPDMLVEDYLHILQKQAMTYVIMAIVLLPIYIFFVYLFYL